MLPYICVAVYYPKQFRIHPLIFLSLFFCFSFWKIFPNVTQSLTRIIPLFSLFMNNFISIIRVLKYFYLYKHSFKFQETVWFSGFSFSCSKFLFYWYNILWKLVEDDCFKFLVHENFLFPGVLVVSFLILLDFLPILDDPQWFVCEWKREGKVRES